MLLRYLELNNFLTHEHEEVRFPEEGMFLLAGESGSGKSSMIVDGVAYALFGSTATRARKQADLLNEEQPGQTLSVKAIFDFAEGERLIIERGHDAKGHTFAKVFTPDPNGGDEAILLAEGAQPVARFLSKRLGGMNWQQFYAAFVARQSEISNLTTLKGADRKNLIHRMLGMRELEKAGELIAGKTRRSRAEVDQLQRSIGAGLDLREAREKISEAKERVTVERSRVEEAESGLAESEVALDSAEQELEPLAESMRQARDLEQQQLRLSSAEQEIGHLEERAERSEKARVTVARESEVADRHQAASEERDSIKDLYVRGKNAASIRTRLAALSEQKNELRLKIASPVPVLVGGGNQSDQEDSTWISAEDARARREVLRAQLSSREIEISERTEQLTRLRESGECYACQRPFSSDHDHQVVVENLEQGLQEMAEIQEADREALASIETALPTLEEIEQLSEEERDLNRRLAELVDEGPVHEDLEALTEKGKEARDVVDQLAQELADINAAKRDLDPTASKRLETARDAMAELREGVELAAAQRADDDAIARFESARARAEQRREEVTAARARLPELRRAAESAERELAGLERDLEGREAELESLERLREKALISENVGSFLRAYQRQLANEIRPALTEIGSEMLSQISNGRHVAMHIDDDYEISVETAKGAIKKAAMLSGGEEIRANICLRLALTRLVSQRTGVPVGFLVFDEPLPSQDAGHVERILELLESLRPFYRQQFIISHVGDLRSADEMNYVLEFRAGDGQNRVQLVNA